MKRIAEFIYEAGILQNTPRSGLWYLGTGSQNVAEHSFRTAIIAYALAEMRDDVDSNRIAVMALFHDFTEARTSDHNYVHQKYCVVDEKKARMDAFANLSFGEKTIQEINNIKDRKTIEAQIVKDADNLELLATLRSEQEQGNKRAGEWIITVKKRMITENGTMLAEELCRMHPDEWWFDRDGQWWISREE